MLKYLKVRKGSKGELRPLFTDEDKANVAWFFHTYFKEKTPWLGLVMVMILIQGFAYQQFIKLTEDGLRVIFQNADVSGLSNEVRQKLTDHRPGTIGQASRISGLTPAAISLLLVHLKKQSLKKIITKIK